MPAESYWLMKSEPDEYSIEDLKRDQETWWDGIRNHQAKQFMQSMKTGDRVLFYHSSCKPPGIAGVMRVLGQAETDPAAMDPSADYSDPKAIQKGINPWLRIRVAYERNLTFIDRSTLKSAQCFNDSPLFKQSRLSIMPITPEQFKWAMQHKK